MKQEHDLYNQIEKYLQGNLDKDTLDEFHSKLKTDNDFSKEVEIQEIVYNLIKGERLASVKTKMDSHFDNKKVKNHTSWIFFLSIFLAVSTFLYLQNKTRANELRAVQNTPSLIPTRDPQSFSDRTKKNVLNEKKVSNKVLPIKTIYLNQTSSATKKIDSTNIKEHLSDINLISKVKKNDSLKIRETKKKYEDTINTTIPKIELPYSKEDSPCLDFALIADITTTPNCDNTGNGSIVLRFLKNNVKPLQYILSNKIGDSIYQETPCFYNLDEGIYNISIIDIHGCIDSSYNNIMIDDVSCTSNNSYSFSPGYDESFEVPNDINVNSYLTIYSRSGQIIYTKTLISGETEYWNGKDNSGNSVSKGIYIYRIKYEVLEAKMGEVLVY